MDLNEIVRQLICDQRMGEREKYWEEKRKECFAKKPLNTYDECWNDMNKWAAFDPNHSFHSYIIFEKFKEDFTKYPIEYQMRLLIDMYIHEIYLNLKSFNAVLRKIYKSESKEFKSQRTANIKAFLKNLNVIQVDDKGNEYIEVYRGANHESATNDIAISWTYNIDIAKWFANKKATFHRDDRCCKVYKGKVKIQDIIFADEDEESENEVITFPHKVYDIEEIEDFVAKYDYNGK